MAILVVILVLLSCYVGVSTIPQETKTSYYIALSVIVFLVILFKIIL